MRTRILNATVFMMTVSMALSLCACQEPGGKNGQNSGNASSSGGHLAPIPGRLYLGGKVALESISIPKSGGQQATVVLKNMSGEDLDDLTARLIFFFPPTDRYSEYSTEPVDDLFKIYRNDTHTLSVTPSGRGEILKVELHVASGQQSLQPTVAREGGSPGSRVLGGLLECVGVDDQLTFEHPAITFTVENVSSESIDMFEYQVVLRKRGAVIAETEWQFVDQGLAPGRRISLKAELGTDVGAAESILRVRRPEL